MKHLILPLLTSCFLASSLSAQTVIFADNFDSADSANINTGITAARQTGTISGDYTPASPTRISINNNTLLVGNDAGGIQSTDSVDLTSELGLANGFEFSISADLAMTGSGTDWLALSLLNSVDSIRGDTPLSFFVREGSGSAAVVVGGANSTNFSTSDLNTTFGSWDPSVSKTYQFDVAMTSPTAGSYDFSINGTNIVTSKAFTLGSASDLRLNFIGIPGAQGNFDNVSVTVIPESSSFALLAAITGLSFVAIRRRRA